MGVRKGPVPISPLGSHLIGRAASKPGFGASASCKLVEPFSRFYPGLQHRELGED